MSKHDAHFVPEGWESLDRGQCVCGTLVSWDETTETWEPDETLRAFVLTQDEVLALVDSLSLKPPTGDWPAALFGTIAYQNDLQNDLQQP